MSDILGYQPTSEPECFVAMMSDGSRVRVRRGRARSYPGLDGPAPPTNSVYRAIARNLGATARVIDVGAGSGAGARLLLAPARTVVGIDPSAEAIAFARAFSPQLELRQETAESLVGAERFNGVTVVDVLGQVDSPVAALEAAHRALASDGVVYVSEPRADRARALEAPQRRAFALEPLEALLVRAGFRPDGAFATPAEFVALRARRAPDARVAAALARCASRSPGAGAVDDVAAALESADDPIEARELLLGFGGLHLALGDPDAAAGSFVGALKLFPSSARGLVGLGAVAERVERPRDALRLYERAVRADDTCVEAWRALGAVRASLQQNDAARDALAIAERLAPTTPPREDPPRPSCAHPEPVA